MHLIIATLHVRESAQAVALAAGCLKSNLPEKYRKNTKLIDLLPDQDNDTILERLLQGKPDLIVFPLYTWNRCQIMEICRRLKQQHPDLILVAGGPEASADSIRVLKQGQLDAVIRGEGEAALATLVDQIAHKQPLSEIPGLVSKTSGEPVPGAALCPDLEALPSPWLERTLPLEEGCGVLWEVARGCHFNCAFCYDTKGHQGVRPLPQKRLKQELELFAARGVSQIWILDSTFNAPPGRGRKLLQMLLGTAPQIHYHIEAKADLLDDETICLLAELQCSVQVGLQSADPKVLSPLQRKLDPQQMIRQLRKLSDAGVTFGLDLIYGLPGDNHQGFRRSLDFALKRQPNQIDIFPLAVLPGTELYEDRDRFGIAGEEQPPYRTTYNRSYSADDMRQSQVLAAAADIFYNRGRAVGFFLQLCQALETTPVEFLEAFSVWLQSARGYSCEELQAEDCWRPETILPLQLAFSGQELKRTKRSKLISAAEDLIRYHFCCAETILADNCMPQPEISSTERMKNSWILNPALQIAPFHYSLEGLEMFGGETLKTIASQLSEEPGYAVFLRQENEMIIETLDSDFAGLLLQARQKQTGKQLIARLKPHTGQELLTFAISQGLLIAADLDGTPDQKST